MRSPIYLLTSLLLSCGPQVVRAQPALPPVPQEITAPPDREVSGKAGTARLSGRVMAADTGKPIRRAVIRATASDLPQPRSVSTDTEGRWELKALPAGR